MKYTKNNAIPSKHLIHNPLNSCNIRTKLENSPVMSSPICNFRKAQLYLKLLIGLQKYKPKIWCWWKVKCHSTVKAFAQWQRTWRLWMRIGNVARMWLSSTSCSSSTYKNTLTCLLNNWRILTSSLDFSRKEPANLDFSLLLSVHCQQDLCFRFEISH